MQTPFLIYVWTVVYVQGATAGTRCSRATGLCLYGCNEGFEGEACVEALKLDKPKDTVPAAAIGGRVAAVAVVSLVVVVGVSIFVRQR
ncbi:hypothetical protein DPMN_147806 [Dreissena polymorpha]|uniref:Uncharacterized protein n=1 Tax=Dreissena polymorpha TaxID=45954 RepID=A0A9D4F8K3_DREPO|nr:hypothetical protein DPMN_147806 [Dreissena polymorpha]